MPPVSGESEHVCPRSLLGKHNYIALYLHGIAEPQIGFSILFKCTYNGIRHPDDAVVAKLVGPFTTLNLCCKSGLCTWWGK